MKKGKLIYIEDDVYNELVKVSRDILKGRRGSHTKNRRIRKRLVQEAFNEILREILFNKEIYEILEEIVATEERCKVMEKVIEENKKSSEGEV